MTTATPRSGGTCRARSESLLSGEARLLRPTAFGYLRTSSAANVGADKDSEPRQRAAIQAYADANGIEIKDWFYDAAVSGANPDRERPGFMAMLAELSATAPQGASLLAEIGANGTRTIIVETANRFARDLMVAESGDAYLRGQDITLIAADSPTAFEDDTPTARLIRQILGAVSEFEKAMVVAKLRAARDRKKAPPAVAVAVLPYRMPPRIAPGHCGMQE